MFEYEISLREIAQNMGINYTAVNSICLNYRLSSFFTKAKHPIKMRVNPKSLSIMRYIIEYKTSPKKHLYLYGLNKFEEKLQSGEINGNLTKLGG